MQRALHIDIETYCDLDLSVCGVYKYAEHPSARLLLFAYSWDNDPVEVVECWNDQRAGDSVPLDVWEALTDPRVLKIAHNANFEIEFLTAFLRLPLEANQWFCTMVGAAYLGLPLGLENVAKVLRLQNQKDARGKALITYFCKPCKPTKTNGGRTVNDPTHDVAKWWEFVDYNCRDVEVEKEIYTYLQKFPPIPENERKAWVLDQRTNKRGLLLDVEFIEAAKKANDEFITTVRAELINLTGVANPNSLPQLKGWLKEQTGRDFHSLNKEALVDYINDPNTPKNVRKVLRLRQMGSKTSIAKYDAMLSYMQTDGRIRSFIQFYGANRTGRYAGRGVQIQNLKRTLKGALLYSAREAIIKGVAGLIYDDVSDIVSKLTRTAIISPKGKIFNIADFAAIEARVLAWEAGEEWVLDVFRTHGKIYEATAANMFGVALDSVTKDDDLRAKGKVATLALGYQGAVGALVKMGALRDGLTEDELPAIVKKWRKANPAIVNFWSECENCAKNAIMGRRKVILRKKYCSFIFSYEKGYLFIELPSGRRLAYYGAEVHNGRVSYFGLNQTTKQWERTDTYGGSLVENLTQAIARDCLVYALFRLEEAGVYTVMHIHDEVVSEIEEDKAAEELKTIDEIMCENPSWAGGLPLKGEGYTSKIYKKD